MTLHNPSEKSAKENQYWREIRHNKPAWRRWMNCQNMVKC